MNEWIAVSEWVRNNIEEIEQCWRSDCKMEITRFQQIHRGFIHSEPFFLFTLFTTQKIYICICNFSWNEDAIMTQKHASSIFLQIHFVRFHCVGCRIMQFLVSLSLFLSHFPHSSVSMFCHFYNTRFEFFFPNGFLSWFNSDWRILWICACFCRNKKKCLLQKRKLNQEIIVWIIRRIKTWCFVVLSYNQKMDIKNIKQ